MGAWGLTPFELFLLLPTIGLRALPEGVDRAGADLLQRRRQQAALLRLRGALQHRQGGPGRCAAPLQRAL